MTTTFTGNSIAIYGDNKQVRKDMVWNYSDVPPLKGRIWLLHSL
jgi:hypothetical protein